MKSCGIVIVAEPAEALSQRPSAFAASTCANPAGAIRPSAISAVAWAEFLADPLEFDFLGGSRCKKESASSGCFCPSIHPKRIASTTQAFQVIDRVSALALNIL